MLREKNEFISSIQTLEAVKITYEELCRIGIDLCVCVCVCDWERQRETERIQICCETRWIFQVSFTKFEIQSFPSRSVII